MPVTHRSPIYEWAGWIRWETSGALVYAWDRPVTFFSMDVSTCKAFDEHRATAFTARFFDATRVVLPRLAEGVALPPTAVLLEPFTARHL